MFLINERSEDELEMAPTLLEHAGSVALEPALYPLPSR